jgi:hypothetical protein
MKVTEEAVSREEHGAKAHCKEILLNQRNKKAPPESGAFESLGAYFSKFILPTRDSSALLIL